MNIEYRKATLNDLNEITNLVNAAIQTMIEEEIYQWDELYPTKEDFKNDIELNQLYVGIIDNKIAITFTLNQESDEEYNHAFWEHPEINYYVLHRICVNPAFQNMKVATNTMKYIEKILINMGIYALRLDVYSLNPYSQKLYANMGYKKTGSANWRKGHFDLMEKYFSRETF